MKISSVVEVHVTGHKNRKDYRIGTAWCTISAE